MVAKKPDSFELYTEDGTKCDVVRHKLTKLKKPIKIRYVADITLHEEDDFDIDFTLYPRKLYKEADEGMLESIHLMETKAVLKLALTEEQLKNDGFFKHLFRDFLSAHFEVHPLDLLIRVIYDEANFPESIFCTFRTEQDTIMNKLGEIDTEFCAYLYERCIAKPNLLTA